MVGGEETAEIAEAGGAEEGVGDCVERGVAVGVALEARRSIDPYSTEEQRASRTEGMAVHTQPDSPGC
jgi:hypothetical protein